MSERMAVAIRDEMASANQMSELGMAVAIGHEMASVN